MLGPTILLGLLAGLVAGAGGAAPASPPPDLEPVDRHWLEEVAPLMSAAERAAFDGIEDAELREAFRHRFWRVRDPTPGTGRNELRERWLSSRDPAEEEGRSPAQQAVLRLLGARPRLLHAVRSCPPLPYMEVWYFSRSWVPPLTQEPGPGPGLEEPFYLLFAEDRLTGTLRQVSGGALDAPWQGEPSLRHRLDKVLRKQRCLRSSLHQDRALSDLQAAFDQALDWHDLMNRAGIPEPPPRWFDLLAPEAAGTLEAELSIAYPARIGGETVLRGLVSLPPAGDASGGRLPGSALVLSGDVTRLGRRVESFRYTFHGLDRVAGDATQLSFERSLAPGPYRLRLRLETLGGELLWTGARTITVPRAPRDAPPPLRTAEQLDVAEALVFPDRPALHLVLPAAGMLVGETPVGALLSGTAGVAVRFSVDGRVLAQDDEPPFEATLDLGESPLRHTVRAVAVDADGRPVAFDQAVVNAGPHRFAVDLAHPPPGTKAGSTFTVRARVTLPTGARLDRLELEVDGELRATLFEPPYVQTLALPAGEQVLFVRAVAHLVDGRSAEDVVVVRGGDYGEELDVQLVELYTTVVDPGGRPVTDLRAEDFTVFDEGERRALHGFRRLSEIPLRVCLALDVSSSMTRALDTVRESGLRFLRQVLQPTDRAAVVAFDHRVWIAAPMTGDLEDLERSVEDIRGGGGTALYDALVAGLHYLGSLEGKRALVLLSDGGDNHSRFEREHVEDLARRSGVAIYTIALGSDRRLRTLRHLAKQTGGRSFTLRRAEQLGAAYETIEGELRSRYLLTFQPPEGAGEEFRRVKVEVAADGLEARTMAGYFPR